MNLFYMYTIKTPSYAEKDWYKEQVINPIMNQLTKSRVITGKFKLLSLSETIFPKMEPSDNKDVQKQ